MGSAAKPVVCIVTPGTRNANNGNWRTAVRWAQMLRDRYKVILQTEWHGEPAAAMVALHARRSASSIEAFARQGRGRGSRSTRLRVGSDRRARAPNPNNEPSTSKGRQ